jgi:hypothetical protein
MLGALFIPTATNIVFPDAALYYSIAPLLPITSLGIIEYVQSEIPFETITLAIINRLFCLEKT